MNLKTENLPLAPLATQAAWAGAGGVQGVYWLPALDSEPPLAQLDIASWKEHLRIRVKLLAAAMRSLYEQVASSGTFLVVGTRMGGHHGYDDGGATAPMGGAVTGFAKTYKRERPNCLVKAVDLATTAGAGAIAAALIEETERDPGAVEVGRQNDLRWTIGLQEQAVEDGRPGMALGPSSVFVVTGAIAAQIARAEVGLSPPVVRVGAPPAASFRPSLPTWRGPQAGRSTSSTWLLSPTPQIRISSDSWLTVMA